VTPLLAIKHSGRKCWRRLPDAKDIGAVQILLLAILWMRPVYCSQEGWQFQEFLLQSVRFMIAASSFVGTREPIPLSKR
jgi:hypothetical protein